MVKLFGIDMIMLYPNLCYNEVGYKGTAINYILTARFSNELYSVYLSGERFPRDMFQIIITIFRREDF